ncbi:glutamate synthase subunit beta [Corynebacterium sp. sy017]|uniref:glutamate synthase subunit beta n=1 Tax=unclassified Corynebacterium TaxID=2624378 RepID=UPI0011863C2D|nr:MULTISPECIES: glutamate synthase subunit beta [unclassified Corynebacterium]MBP3088017.1 glutamate synthase subunit beta [Corynebacterium sp. sy017]QDZ42973.1 glutamate synthase subunit beta [Corynebacterium sp. sy039]TSD92546.1 glutamate synthase subunit beta [Corynebacterium sp. SY003]
MADPHGFQKFPRQEPAHRPVPLRLMDWREVYEEAPAGQIQQQATRCMDCGVPFCHEGCPLGNIIPEWNDLVRQDRWREAFDRLHATNNFPEFTGRLCPAPCEGACVLGISDDAVTIKNVELAIVEHGFSQGWVTPITPSFDTGIRIAVVGSGPAGLAAAQQLRRAGHGVTVFERDDRIGGLMRYGVPEYKMENKWIDRRLAQMSAEGIEFRTGVSPTAADLDRYDAVILATGTPVPRDLPVEGRELGGIYPAMDYLNLQNRICEGDTLSSTIDARGKKVVIIGGGDTGTDCFGTALRQGAASVTQFDIRPRAPKQRASSTPWPTYPLIYRTATAHEEGEYIVTGNESAQEIEDLGLATRKVGDTLGNRTYSVNTVSFHGKDGHVRSLRANEVRVENGKRVPIEGTEFDLDADLVLLALGFSGAERSGVIHELGVAFDERGRMVRDEHYRASIKPLFPDFKPKVYVAGDCGRGQSLIVWAIAEGRACAAAVDADLMGETSLPIAVTPRTAPLGA